MQKKFNQRNKYFFSERLKRQLDQISHHPLTIVEAPSGFGKTTAVREYLREKVSHGACEYWYTCLGEPASMAWLGICELFSNVSIKVADDLKNMQMPTLDTLFFITAHLRDITCQMETYLVVDNYQLVNCDIPRELISVFSMHGNPKLHMIFITQQLEVRQQVSIHNNNIYTLDASPFFFDREGTANLFRMEGIRLTDDELEKIFMSTEGWVSAIRLHMINFKETGFFDPAADIEQLVERAIWNNLTPQERDFFLSVSILDSFSARQAAIMLNQEVLPDKIIEILKNNEFIRYLPDKYRYSMHSILQDYLRNRFYNEMPEDYQNRTFRRAGTSCVAVSRYYPASEFFFRIRDFDAILSLPFSIEYLDKQREKYQSELIVRIVHECPEKTLCSHPLTMIIFGYYTLMNGQTEVYQRLCSLLEQTVHRKGDFLPDEIRKIHGEYELLAAFGEFNDLSRMKERQKRAWEILGQPSEVIKEDAPWLFASPTVLGMFWRETGKLEHILKEIEESSPFYQRLVRGHGAGAFHVMQAEAMLMRGKDDEAEIHCHKALYEARGSRQASICISSELVLARIAILRGDVESYFKAIKRIQDYAKENTSLYVLHMVECCMSVISIELGIKDYVAPWLYDIESIKKMLYDPVIPHAQIFYLKLLLMEKRYNELYGISQLLLDNGKKQEKRIKYMLPQIYNLKFLAIAKYNNGHQLEALEYLKQALAAALPDKVYLPLIQDAGCLAPLYESLKNFIPDKDGINAVLELGRRHEKGMKIIRKAIISDKTPLTPREREIALLARNRLRAREISDKLCISETTVRTILRNVYSKLDIHSKTELDTKEF